MFDGIVTLEDSEIPVVVRFDAAVLNLSSNGTRIGEWPPGEYAIDPVAEGIYTITAENESLYFKPSQPKRFAEHLTLEMRGHGTGASTSMGRHLAEPELEDSTVQASLPSSNPLSRVGFYALSALTAALGIWALVSIVF